MPDNDNLLKLVLVGDTKVGKTCLMKQFVDEKFDLEEEYTVGVEFGTKTIPIGNKRIKLQIWDTAGQKRFGSITKSYYRGAAIFLLCCDLTNRASFTGLKSRLDDIRERASDNYVIGLVGTKADLDISRKVTDEELNEFCMANQLDFYTACSATENTNIETIFETATSKFLKKINSKEIVDDARIGNASNSDTLTPQQLRKIYKTNGGDTFVAARIFGFFSANPLQECIATLETRSANNPDGASFRTLAAYNNTQTRS